MKNKDIRKVVRQRYAEMAKGRPKPEVKSSCGCKTVSCCGPTDNTDISKQIGYSDSDLKSIPEGADLGLGCGNPLAFVALNKGDVVLDLGSGAGIDCFIAAKKVGPKGKVIGVDMTPDMLEKARENAMKGGYKNVEFRMGEIEHLPVGDNQINLIISNCVINLSPDKLQVFREAFRVLKPNGKLMVSDLVLLEKLPKWAEDSVNLYVGCVAGAMLKQDYLKAIKNAGFKDVKVLNEDEYPVDYFLEDASIKKIVKELNVPAEKLKSVARSIVSVKIMAMKPK